MIAFPLSPPPSLSPVSISVRILFPLFFFLFFLRLLGEPSFLLKSSPGYWKHRSQKTFLISRNTSLKYELFCLCFGWIKSETKRNVNMRALPFELCTENSDTNASFYHHYIPQVPSNALPPLTLPFYMLSLPPSSFLVLLPLQPSRGPIFGNSG